MDRLNVPTPAPAVLSSGLTKRHERTLRVLDRWHVAWTIRKPHRPATHFHLGPWLTLAHSGVSAGGRAALDAHGRDAKSLDPSGSMALGWSSCDRTRGGGDHLIGSAARAGRLLAVEFGDVVFDHLGGDVAQLGVRVRRGSRQEGEGGIGIEPVLDHQHAYGLPDELAGA
jgi:hypothetical protein